MNNLCAKITKLCFLIIELGLSSNFINKQYEFYPKVLSSWNSGRGSRLLLTPFKSMNKFPIYYQGSAEIKYFRRIRMRQSFFDGLLVLENGVSDLLLYFLDRFADFHVHFLHSFVETTWTAMLGSWHIFHGGRMEQIFLFLVDRFHSDTCKGIVILLIVFPFTNFSGWVGILLSFNRVRTPTRWTLHC